MKTCPRCKIEKEGKEFGIHSRKRDGLQNICKSCKADYDRAHFKANPGLTRARNLAKRNRNSLRFFEYMKTKKCEWEGCTISDPDMLTLDHLDPKTKIKDVSTLIRSCYGWETIMKEIAKCRVLCANHHHKHTIEQFGYKKWRN